MGAQDLHGCDAFLKFGVKFEIELGLKKNYERHENMLTI
jgi:hypothetical protein